MDMPYGQASVAPPAPFALRPLTTGEVMDRSFALFRASFLVCVGISMVPALLAVLQLAARLIYLKVAHLSPLTPMWSTPGLAVLAAISTTLSVFSFGWASAGVCWVAARRYLGQSATIRDAYGVVLRHPFRYPVLLLWQLLRAGWLPLVLYATAFGMIGFSMKSGGIALRLVGSFIMLLAGLSTFLAMYLYIGLSLGMPAAILEDLPSNPALRRSKDLLNTRKGRVFLVLLLIGAFYFVLAILLGAVGFVFMRSHINLVWLQAAGLLSNFVTTLLLQPLLMVALVVVYYDERVRREGFDVLYLMQQADLAAPPIAPAPWAAPPATP